MESGQGFADGGQDSRSEEFRESGVAVVDGVRRPELGFDLPIRFRALKKQCPTAFDELESKFKRVAGHYVSTIGEVSFPHTKKYVSDVLLVRGPEHRREIVEYLHGSSPRYHGKLLIWAAEGSHVHIVHDCAYSNGSCRCALFNSGLIRDALFPALRRQRFLRQFDSIDFYNVIIYFILQKWESEREIWINRELQRLPTESEIVQWQDLCRESAAILAGKGEGHGHCDSERVEDGESSIGDLLPGHEGTSKKRRSPSDASGTKPPKRSKWHKVLQQTQTLLEEYLPIPAHQLRHLLIGDPRVEFLFDPGNLRYYEAACDYFLTQVNNYSFADFKHLYDGKEPIFYANNQDVWNYYHSMDESVDYMSKLLLHQFDHESDNVTSFLENLRNWFNKEGWAGNPKVNAIAIIGPPNSGKNYFFDAIAALAYNVGHIGRVNNKTNNFALQDCYNRRLVMGNEISMEEGAKEDFKKLCEGTALNIRVKYQGDKIFNKTPVCLISNHTLDICNDPTFKNVRLQTFRWHTCTLLRDSKLKPYPLSIFKLYEMYGVEI